MQSLVTKQWAMIVQLGLLSAAPEEVKGGGTWQKKNPHQKKNNKPTHTKTPTKNSGSTDKWKSVIQVWFKWLIMDLWKMSFNNFPL